jgi:putative membrane protein
MKNIDLPNYINNTHYLISVGVGLSFILLGSFIAFQSAAHHRRYIKTLPPEDLPTNYFFLMGSLAGYAICIGGIFLTTWIIPGIYK